jgi:hypothetical protein
MNNQVSDTGSGEPLVSILSIAGLIHFKNGVKKLNPFIFCS